MPSPCHHFPRIPYLPRYLAQGLPHWQEIELTASNFSLALNMHVFYRAIRPYREGQFSTRNWPKPQRLMSFP